MWGRWSKKNPVTCHAKEFGFILLSIDSTESMSKLNQEKEAFEFRQDHSNNRVKN